MSSYKDKLQKICDGLFIPVPPHHRDGFALECFRINSHRLYIQSIVIGSLEILMIAGSLIAKEFLGRALDTAYYFMYSFLLAFMIGASVLFRRIRNKPPNPSILLLNLPVLYSGVLLLWSVGITLLDQRTYGQIIVYTVGLLVTAVLTYTPPKALLGIYLSVQFIFTALIPYYQDSSWIATGHFANTTIMVITAWFIGRALYQAKLKDYQSFKELVRLNGQLEYLSYHDELTAIPNRRMFLKYMEEQWNRAILGKTPISLLFVDVDAFKEFNDLYGHPAGDDCLQKIALALSDCLSKPYDLVSRYGGEEFTVLLPETTVERAEETARNICCKVRALGLKHEGEKAHGTVTVSIGIVSSIPRIGSDYKQFIAAADKALYQSKSNGRNTFTVAASF